MFQALKIATIILVFGAILCFMPAVGFGAVRAMYPYSWCYADWNAKESKDKVYSTEPILAHPVSPLS